MVVKHTSEQTDGSMTNIISQIMGCPLVFTVTDHTVLLQFCRVGAAIYSTAFPCKGSVLVSAIYRATLTSHLLARLLFLLTCLSTPLFVSTFLSCPSFLVYRHDSWRLCRPTETSLLSLSPPLRLQATDAPTPPSHPSATELVSHISSLAHSVGEKGEGTFTSQKAHTPLLRERG